MGTKRNKIRIEFIQLQSLVFVGHSLPKTQSSASRRSTTMSQVTAINNILYGGKIEDGITKDAKSMGEFVLDRFKEIENHVILVNYPKCLVRTPAVIFNLN